MFVLLDGFAHREKENVVRRFVFPCWGAAAKIIVKSGRRLGLNRIVNFLSDRFSVKSNGGKMKNLRLLVAIDQIAFNN